MDAREPRKAQKTAVYTGLLLFSLVLFLIQLWLFVTVLERQIAGEPSRATITAIVSACILALNVWMLVGLYRLDAQD